eukprot:463946-Lingulodinium_polyedra.AAC.1
MMHLKQYQAWMQKPKNGCVDQDISKAKWMAFLADPTSITDSLGPTVELAQRVAIKKADMVTLFVDPLSVFAVFVFAVRVRLCSRVFAVRGHLCLRVFVAVGSSVEPVFASVRGSRCLWSRERLRFTGRCVRDVRNSVFVFAVRMATKVTLRDMEGVAKKLVTSEKEKKNSTEDDVAKMTAKFQRSGFKQSYDKNRFESAKALVRGACAASLAGEAGAFAESATIAVQIEDVTDLLPESADEEENGNLQ